MPTGKEMESTERATACPHVGSEGFLDLLRDVAVISNLAEDPESALILATEQICRATGWRVGHAYTIETDGELESTGVWHVEDDLDLCTFGDHSIASDFSHGQGLPGRVAVTGQPSFIEDIETDSDFPRRDAALESGLRSGFAFPVLVGSATVAILEFFATERTTPGPELLDVMSQIGVQLGRVFERESAQDDLRSSEHRALQILNSSGDAYIAMDSSDRITEWNKAAESMFGWERHEVIGKTVSEMIVPTEFREAHVRGVERFLATEEPQVLGQHVELRACHRSGHEFPIDITMWSIKDGDEWSFYAFIRDIAKRKKQERELEYDSLHDSLTGLPNRGLLQNRLDEALSRGPDRTSVAVFFVDLDRFKLINDSLGHDAGDEVLKAVASRLLGSVRPTDIVARLGSDEFVLVCEFTDDTFDPTTTARRILTSIAGAIRSGGDSMYVTASVGIAVAESGQGTGSDSAGLLAAADAAMHQAKQSGRGRYSMFDTAMKVRTQRRVQIEADLRRAVDKGEFTLHYQPLISLEHDAPIGVEALIRWEHPEHGLLSPVDFIPIAEETGLIVPLGTWVIEEAQRQALRWQREARPGPPLKIAVNLSARQLAQSNLLTTVRGILDKTPVDPTKVQLGFEITESTLMVDPQAAERALHELRELGVTLSIDDFGTGYSSLSYLKRFPVQTVKIDRSFIISIDTDPADQAIVSGVIELAHALGMSVVAEGVETHEQLEVLRRLGADVIQGFLFSRPLPADQVHELLFRSALHR